MLNFAKAWHGGAAAIAALLLAGSLAQAQVVITSEKSKLGSREECHLKAEVEGEGPWRWRFQGQRPFGAVLTRISATEARFTAPVTRVGGVCTVVLEAEQNPSIRGEFQITVRPSRTPAAGGRHPGDAFLPGSFRPSLAPFRGNPAAHTGPTTRLPQAAKLAFCDEAFADGAEPTHPLNRCWIVAGQGGLQAFTLAGETVPVPGVAASAPPAQAVAVRPPGPGASHGPRLVYSESGPEGSAGGGEPVARIVALEPDGNHRELARGGAGPLPGGRAVRDLALDRDGNVFVVFSGERRLWRIEPDGNTAVHARLPETAASDELPGGILALALDPATGNLYVGEAAGVHQVTASGAVTPLLAGDSGPAQAISGCHLALHGRELLIIDAGRHQIQVFHLDSRRRATLLASAGSQGWAPTRLGPLPGFQGQLDLDACAALGATGPLASNQEGMGLLAVGDGFAVLDLPALALTQALEAQAPEARRASRTTRQQTLERFRTLQLETRQYKKNQRLLRREAAQEAAAAEAFEAELAEVAELPWSRSGRTTRPAMTPRGGLGGLFCLTLLGLSSLSDPLLLGALAQTTATLPGPTYNWTAQIHRYAAEAEAGLGPFGPACGAPLVASLGVAPCGEAYRTGVAAQVQDLRAQMERLFVEPQVLGASACLPDAQPARATARVVLGISDISAEYDGLAADAGTLQFQLLRDGFVLRSVGAGFLAGQAGALAVGGGAAGPGAIPARVLGEVGHGLNALSFGAGAVGAGFGKISSLTLTFKAKYQRWATGRGQALLEQCPGAAAARPRPWVATGTGAESPLPALKIAAQKLTAGCALTAQHGLNLPVCSQAALEEFSVRNATLGALQAGLTCLFSGIPRGSEVSCPRLPLPDAGLRSQAFSYLAEWVGETTAAAYDAIGTGNAFFVAAEGLVIAGTAAAATGAPAAGMLAGSATLAALGNGILADGYDLLRIGAKSGRWAAEVTLGFNAESRAELEAKTDSGGTGAPASAPGSSTGAAAAAYPAMAPAAAAVPTPAADPTAAAVTTPAADPTAATLATTGRGEASPGGGSLRWEDPESATLPAELAISSAARTRPGLLDWLRRGEL